MGNHAVGRAMVQTAEALIKVRAITGQTPLDILDIACGPYKKPPDAAFGYDAEFDDSTNPGEPFGDLIIKAFAPEGKYDSEADPDSDIWFEEIYTKFSDRYGFC